MCLNLYDCQSRASRYSYGLTYLRTSEIKNQKCTIYLQKPKRKEFKHNTTENHQTTKGKQKATERNKEELQNQLENKG